MYRTWVHFSEAKKCGAKLTLGRKPWKLKGDTLYGYGKDKNKGKLELKTSIDEYKTYGFWTSPEFLPNMYVKVIDNYTGTVEFRGLIATGRIYRSSYYRKTNFHKSKNNNNKNQDCTFITIGYKTGYLIDLTVYGIYKIGLWDVIRGKGKVKEYVKGGDYLTIDVTEHKFERL